MRGRKPKPTKLKLLEGNPGKRPINEDEPQPPSLPITECQPPKFLDLTARAEWNRVAPQLIELGILTAVDVSQLAAYCESFSTWVRAQAKVKKLGDVILGSKKSMIRNPYIKIARDAKQDMLKFAQEFGITPSSRTRLHVGEKDQDDPFEAFLSGK